MLNVILLLVEVTLAYALIEKNPYCELGCDFGDGVPLTHTVCQRGINKCGPATACGPNFKVIRLTDQQRQMILNMHNALRCRVTLGSEMRGKQPPAKNMRVMTYDRELEFIAQCWANACEGTALKHDKCRRTRKHEHNGQNLGYINSSVNNINFTLAMQQLITHWYDEVALFNNQWVYDTRDRGVKVGHYTQMVWADTHKIGCAAVYYTVNKPDGSKWHEFLFVCNYGPGGNYLGEAVYKPGSPGSACPDKLNSNNSCGMCGKFINVIEGDGYRPFFKL
ncbi:hypothetical protein PPYR_07867 [Photinus pyralis]|uniref:SCP domain-containing protein n=2 Tax=Photinus pyralis TaxID=7054 RepID=A0A5N4ARN5_PHOPY|nr:venom allergen 5-like [Photinus pyralis]KAB0799987.1 hypothetical protein PPYR_07867 [Photinus pyralis]